MSKSDNAFKKNITWYFLNIKLMTKSPSKKQRCLVQLEIYDNYEECQC